MNGSHWTSLGLSFSTSNSCPQQSHPPPCSTDQVTVLAATLLWLPAALGINLILPNRGWTEPCLVPPLPCHCTTTYTLGSSTLTFCQYLERIKLFPTYELLYCFPCWSLSSPELICIKESSQCLNLVNCHFLREALPDDSVKNLTHFYFLSLNCMYGLVLITICNCVTCLVVFAHLPLEPNLHESRSLPVFFSCVLNSLPELGN